MREYLLGTDIQSYYLKGVDTVNKNLKNYLHKKPNNR